PFLRLGFSYHDSAELDEAVRRMARALIRTRSSKVTTQKPVDATKAATPPKRRDANLNGKASANQRRHDSH
ncbi:MAG: hypothetical protein ACREP1_03835, partial [Rhodanobacteraceae bacterium]